MKCVSYKFSINRVRDQFTHRLFNGKIKAKVCYFVLLCAICFKCVPQYLIKLLAVIVASVLFCHQ